MSTPLMDNRRPPRILFVFAEDGYFRSHRLALVRAVKQAGFDVGVVTNSVSNAEPERREGIQFFQHNFRRTSVNALFDLGTIRRLAALYTSFRPDLVHHVAIKPVLYGSMASRLARVPATLNAISGLGFVLSSTSPLARLVRPAVKMGLRAAMRHDSVRLIVQNSDDAAYFSSERLIARERIHLISGVGVCTQQFSFTNEPSGTPLVVLPSRLLREKGVHEFVEAARRIKGMGVAARFALVGNVDANPASLTQAEVDAIAREGVVEVWGHRLDIHAVYESAHVVCLPSYREGLPKALLEAAACGRPVVATDVPGCREVVRHGETGLLVPAKDVDALVGALLTVIRDADLRRRFGVNGRQLILERFTEQQSISTTLGLYLEMVAETRSVPKAAIAKINAAETQTARTPEPSDEVTAEQFDRQPQS